MGYRGLIDPQGDLLGYLSGSTLYTLNDEPTGRIEGEYVVDLEGNRMWRVQGDAVYTLDGTAVGYFGEERSDEYDF